VNSNGAEPIRVRAVESDGAIFVHLGDLIGYVQAAANVPHAPRQLIAGLLRQLGAALESE
jgi:hypothetical protein